MTALRHPNSLDLRPDDYEAKALSHNDHPKPAQGASTMPDTLPPPPPFTPDDCDLRGLTFMPLDVLRLRDSDLALHASGDAFKAAVLLWCVAWHQTPAGSLPNDDRALAHWAHLDLKTWKKVRAVALTKFHLCADGRLYHEVVAEKALEAWQERRNYRKRRDADRARLQAWREKHGKGANENGPETDGETGNETHPETHPETHRETPDETRVETRKTEKGTCSGEKGQESSLRSEGAKRGSRLPPDWVPSEIDRAYALKQGFSAATVERMAERFRNYWTSKTGKAATKLDWPATWRNWVLEEADRRPPQGRAPAQVDWIG